MPASPKPLTKPLSEKQIRNLVRVQEKFLQKQQELQDAGATRTGLVEVILDGYPEGTEIDLQNGVLVLPAPPAPPQSDVYPG